MPRRLLYITAASAIAFLLASAGETEAQILRSGRFGGRGGFSLDTPSFSIAVSRRGITTVRTPYGIPHPLALPAFPYDAYMGITPYASAHPYPAMDPYYRFSPPRSEFDDRVLDTPYGASSYYRSPQERYAMPLRSYGTASSLPGSSPYSYGAPLPPADQRDQAEETRALPFARSPYDADPAVGFGVTGTAPARSLSDRELQNALVRAASELDDALASQQDGDVWQEYLQPMVIAETFRPTDAAMPDEESVRSLWTNFEAITGNEDLHWVRRTDGFARTKHLLEEWLRRRSEGEGTGLAVEAASEVERDLPTIEAEELPAPSADPLPAEQPQLNPPQTDQPQSDPPRRYDI